MALIQVKSNDSAIVIDVVQDYPSLQADPTAEPDQEWVVGICRACKRVITDRGVFEDSLQQCEQHADSCGGAR